MNRRLKVALPGDRFGRWVVLREGPPSPTQRRLVCECDCGTRRLVHVSSLTNGRSRSCGCLHREVSAALVKRLRTSHGGSSTNEYRIWLGIMSRCLSPGNSAWRRYGGRGIRVCTRWLRFENFIADMGPRPSRAHSIDRKDRDGHYEPENCRWATTKEQGNNTARNRFLVARGERRTVAQWADLVGLDPGLIWARVVRLGWAPERAIFTPRVSRAESLRRNRLRQARYQR